MRLLIDKTPTIFDEGFLADFFVSRITKDGTPKLENNKLTRIATVLGILSKDYDLYDILFDQPKQTLKIDTEYCKEEVSNKDLAAFVMMDHTITRGYFTKQAAGRAMVDTTNCQGVPLALEGAKRTYNKTYMSWLKGIDLGNIEEAWKVDVFLPANLASIELDDAGNRVLGASHGLLVLMHNNIIFSPAAINQLRQQVPKWETTPTPKLVDADEIPDGLGKVYNKCAHKLRCMILQGWVWAPVCRNEDMICNINNWDEFPASVGFEGLAPRENSGLPAGIERFLHR